jgi:hypothetical protein
VSSERCFSQCSAMLLQSHFDANFVDFLPAVKMSSRNDLLIVTLRKSHTNIVICVDIKSA